MESVGEWENRECGRTESEGERRVRENGECGRTESAGEQRVQLGEQRELLVYIHSPFRMNIVP